MSSAVDPGKLFFTADNTVSSAVDPGKLFFTADNSSELGILYNSWSLKSYTSVCIENFVTISVYLVHDKCCTSGVYCLLC